MHLYISFHTSAEAMATEKKAKLNNINGKLVPLPRRISASCGMAYETDISSKDLIKRILEENDIAKNPAKPKIARAVEYSKR